MYLNDYLGYGTDWIVSFRNYGYCQWPSVGICMIGV